MSRAPSLLVIPLGSNGKALPSAFNNNDVSEFGSTGGMYFTQDRVTVAEGRMPNPTSTHEMMATAEAARLSGWHLGETVAFGAYSLKQAKSATFNPLTRRRTAVLRQARRARRVLEPGRQRRRRSLPDRRGHDPCAHPAAARERRPTRPTDCVSTTGDASRRAWSARSSRPPPGTPYSFHVTSVVEGEVERASKPEAIALGVFGAIARLAALLIAGQAISRQLWANAEGARCPARPRRRPPTTTATPCSGWSGRSIVGALVAWASPWRCHRSRPDRTGAARWTRHRGSPSTGRCSGSGLAVLTVGLGGLTVALAYRGAHRRARRTRRARAAVGPRRGRRPVGAARAGPRRAAFLPRARPGPHRGAGAIGPGRRRVGRDGRGGDADLRERSRHPRLASRPVRMELELRHQLAWGQQHPSCRRHAPRARPRRRGLDRVHLRERPDRRSDRPGAVDGAHAALGPPILSGHAIDAGNQIVLGAATLAALHKKLGDTVTVSYGAPQDAPVYVPPHPSVIVGTATMPAIGTSGHLHASMGTGAVLPTGLGRRRFKRALTQPRSNLNGPAIEFVRLRRGVIARRGPGALQRIVDDADKVMAADPNGAGDSSACWPSSDRPRS